LTSPQGGNLETFPGNDLFAALASFVFGAMAKDTTRERWFTAKVFAEFMVIGLVLSWILYFIP
jgi:hypothetical protein